MKKSKRLVALALSLAMCLGLLGASAVALADANNYFSVRACLAGGATDSSASTYTYDTLQEVKNHIDGETATDFTIVVHGTPTGTNPVTFNRASIAVYLSGASGSTLRTPMILSNSIALQVNTLNMNVTGNTAITLNATGASVKLMSGAAVRGNPHGVLITNGSLSFQGGGVSSYQDNVGGATSGSAIILPTLTPSPTATPTPTATWYPTWPTATSGSNVATTGVRLNTSSVSIEEGDTYRLTATVSPTNATNKNVTWSSSNSSVATVSGGTVRAHRPGRAVITVRTSSGGYTATCTVTVTEAYDYTYDYDTADYVEENIRYTLAGKTVSGTTTSSSTRITVRPLKRNDTSTNRIDFPTDALRDMRDDGYNCVRYDLSKIDVEIYRTMATNMGSSNFWLSVRKVTPSGSMKTQWNKIKSKNLSGPWTISSNSSRSGLVLRIDLPKYYKKSSLKLVRWNGSRFTDVSTKNYSVVKSGGVYLVRSDVMMAPGTYAVVRR